MPSVISQALQLAQDRRIFPTHLGTEQIRELERELLDRSFWSARTTHEVYLRELKKLVDRFIHGEAYNHDIGQLRLEARKLLIKCGYTPEQGFPGDAALGIPSARPGSLKDLSSEQRLNLIFDTQAALMRGKGQKLRGQDRVEQFPAWELIRYEQRNAPRDWLERWKTAGATVIKVDGLDRLIAPKDAEVWSVLGDSAIFNDALNVDHPPFAFNSGMGWLEVDVRTWDTIKAQWEETVPEPAVHAPTKPAKATPDEGSFIGGKPTLDALMKRLEARRRQAGLA